MPWNEFVGTVSLLFALVNPIGVVPILLELLRRRPEASPRRVIVVATGAVTVLLGLSVILGGAALQFFNVGLDDFRIAGGLLAVFIAFEMFQAHYGGFMQTIDERQEAAEDVHGIAITPLAFPLLVGPAEIGIMVTLSNDMAVLDGKLWLLAAALTTGLLVALTLLLAEPIRRVFGKTGINVATRIMALIVATIGVSFIMDGIANRFSSIMA